MSRQNAMTLVRQIQAEIRERKIKGIMESNGRLKLSTLLRISEMQCPMAAVSMLVQKGYAKSEEDVIAQLKSKEVQDLMLPSYTICKPQPMSDDRLDRTIQYVHISRELLDKLPDE